MATVPSPMREWSLLQIINEYLKPQNRHTFKTLRGYRGTCKRFEKFAGAEQLAVDVTDKSLVEFLVWQKAAGYKSKNAARMAQAIASVVRHADDALLPRWVPRARAIDGAANEPTQVVNWPLVRVVNDLVKPTGTRALRTIVKYRQACRRYCRFRGGPQRVCNVTVETVEAFLAWQMKEGYSQGTATDACDHLATVVRCADKGRLPVKYRRVRFADAIPNAFADRDVDGTLESIMINQYFPSRSRIANPKTELQYAWAAARFSKHLGQPATLADLSDLSLGRWIRSMRAENLAAKTSNGYMNKIRAFWRWAAETRLVEKFPTIENTPEPTRIPTAWRKEQVVALVDATGKMPGMVGKVPAPSWWRNLHLVALDTGERCSALMSLRWDHLDPNDGTLEAPAEIRKGGRKPMLYVLKPATLASLMAMRRPDAELILEWPHNIGKFYADYRKLLQFAELPYESRRTGLQKIRRTFASHIEAAGGNATAALGHTARKVTEESYLDPRIIKLAPPNRLIFDV